MKPSKATRRVEPPRWPTVRCPGCQRSWLAAGVRGGDTYTCKACGRQFVVGKQEAAGKTGLALG
jgi:transposase-like protein